MVHTSNMIKVAILVADGFEQVQMNCPRKVLNENGVVTHIISPSKDQVRGWNQIDWGETYPVDVPLNMARAEYYDALLLPGGVMSSDILRSDATALEFVFNFFLLRKYVATICHGAQILIDVDVVNGRTLTSVSSIRTDLENAGAKWVNRPLVNSDGLITSRNVDDLPLFIEELVRAFTHENQPRHLVH
jgi:protease I